VAPSDPLFPSSLVGIARLLTTTAARRHPSKSLSNTTGHQQPDKTPLRFTGLRPRFTFHPSEPILHHTFIRDYNARHAFAIHLPSQPPPASRRTNERRERACGVVWRGAVWGGLAGW
jgi:hypothetical protein